MSLGESGLGVRGRFPATPLTAGDGDFLANSLGLPLVSKALEPLPYACREAMRRLGFDPQCTAIVGDQICADIMAGRPAGRAVFYNRFAVRSDRVLCCTTPAA